MNVKQEYEQLREHYLLALIEATYPLQKGSVDPEVTLELLIQAAESLKQHLKKELDNLRQEQAE